MINYFSDILKYHIIPHTVCSSAIIGNVSTHNMDGEEFMMVRNDEDRLFINNDVEIIKPDVVGNNGVAHFVNSVLLPDSGMFNTKLCLII